MKFSEWSSLVICVFAITLNLASTAQPQKRDVNTIASFTKGTFKNGGLAVVQYHIILSVPLLQRLYKIDGVQQKYLDEHELKESDGKYEYFVLLGPVTHNFTLRLDVIYAGGNISSTTKIIVNDKDNGEFITGAKYGQICNETVKCTGVIINSGDAALGPTSNRGLAKGQEGPKIATDPVPRRCSMCVTDKTDCDLKTETCSCRQGYHWDKNACRMMEYGEQCNSTAWCGTPNSECHPETEVCSCLQGYYWDWPICNKTVTYGEGCKSTEACGTNNTECDPKTNLCECLQGYHWDSTVCKTNGVMGMLVVRQEGIAMLVLATLFAMFRTTTSTAG